jgi:hypothetical protein
MHCATELGRGAAAIIKHAPLLDFLGLRRLLGEAAIVTQFELMRPSKHGGKSLSDESKSTGIRVYVPRVHTSSRLSGNSAEQASAGDGGGWRQTVEQEDTYLQGKPAYNIGVPARPLPYAFSDVGASDSPAELGALLPHAHSPLHVSRMSPRRNSPPRASSPPTRDAGGTVYQRPLLLPQTLIPQSDVFVHRSQSFLSAATRPPTRQAKAPPADIATQAVKLVCNGPALDRFPLSVQGGLSAGQVKRSYAPAYEPRVLGQERQPLSQTWLVPNAGISGEAPCIYYNFTSQLTIHHRARQDPRPVLSSQQCAGLGDVQADRKQKRGA